MGNIPRQRKSGQVGGGGRIGQTGNRNASSNRGGRPHAGGAGGGKRPNKGCCEFGVAVRAVGLMTLAATAVIGTAIGLASLGVAVLINGV